MVIDELKIIQIKDDLGNVYDLKANFKALKKMNKLIKDIKIENQSVSDFFNAISMFYTNVAWRLELLPYFVLSMIDDDNITLEHVEEHILGMTITRVQQMVGIIFEIMQIELNTNKKDDEEGEDKPKKNKKK